MAAVSIILLGSAQATTIDIREVGSKLNAKGWSKKSTATYTIDHVAYRTYKPVLTKSPDGSVFASMRVDALPYGRSKTVCYLQMTVSRAGYVVGIQGKVRFNGVTYDSGLVSRPALTPRPAEGEKPAQNLTPWNGPISQMTSEMFSRLDTKIQEADKNNKDKGRDLWARLSGTNASRINIAAAMRHNLNILAGSIRR